MLGRDVDDLRGEATDLPSVGAEAYGFNEFGSEVRFSGTDFNYDFGVTIDESVAPGEYNFRTKAEFEAMGSGFFESGQPFEMPGRSCFLQAGGRVFHTYSQYARGLESTGGSYYFLDLTALGRQEEWEEPKGRSESARSATPDFAS